MTRISSKIWEWCLVYLAKKYYLQYNLLSAKATLYKHFFPFHNHLSMRYSNAFFKEFVPVPGKVWVFKNILNFSLLVYLPELDMILAFNTCFYFPLLAHLLDDNNWIVI